MARIRTIKPELFRHEELYRLEHESGMPIRLAFAGLFTVADREGRFRWKPVQLKLDVLPYDNIDFGLVLDALESIGLLKKYQSGAEVYGCIPTWKHHQVINVREAQSKLPPPEEGTILEGPRSRHIPADLKRQVRARASTCDHCGSTDNLQFDHIVPFSKGGEHTLDNLQLLCRACNLKKSDSTETHVHAHGELERELEGKRKGKGKGTVAESNACAAVVALAPTSAKPSRQNFSQELVEHWKEEFAKRYQEKPHATGPTWGAAKSILKAVPIEHAKLLVTAYFEMNDHWFLTKRHDLQTLLGNVNAVQVYLGTGQTLNRVQMRQHEAKETALSQLDRVKKGLL